MIIIRKGDINREKKEKATDSQLARSKAIEDYNIMMGYLEDPEEE